MTRFDPSTIAPGTIVAVSDDVCVMRSEDGSLHAFARRCPHAGADLANAYVSDGRVRCAWHNLPFDPRTGDQPCATLEHLAVYELVAGEDGWMAVTPGRSAARRTPARPPSPRAP